MHAKALTMYSRSSCSAHAEVFDASIHVLFLYRCIQVLMVCYRSFRTSMSARDTRPCAVMTLIASVLVILQSLPSRFDMGPVLPYINDVLH